MLVHPALSKDNWLTIKHVLCYVHDISHFGLSLIASYDLLLYGFSDSN